MHDAVHHTSPTTPLLTLLASAATFATTAGTAAVSIFSALAAIGAFCGGVASLGQLTLAVLRRIDQRRARP